MKKIIWLSFIGMIFCFSVGMGSMGEMGAISIPEPEENYAVTLIDQSDVSIKLEKFSSDGYTFFVGKMGKANISIDFNKIISIIFLFADNQVKGKITLKNKKIIELIMEKNKFCYGVSTFADVRIMIKDIKKITIHGKAPL